jgi:putative ABC transport system permease protein
MACSLDEPGKEFKNRFIKLKQEYTTMILINLKQAVRNLLRNKVYTFINLTGLAVSSAFVILVVLYIYHAFQMDMFSSATKNIHRIEMTDLFNASQQQKPKGIFNQLAADANYRFQTATPLILADDLKKNFTEVTDVTRFNKGWNPIIRVNNQSFREDGSKIARVDRNFFSFMDLPLMQGNKVTPFDSKNSVVITERAAKKYFGTANPVGQIISIKEIEEQLFTVTAIAENFPHNSSLQFDVMWLNEADERYEQQIISGTNSMSHTTLFKLKPGTDEAAFQNRLNSFGKVYFKDFVKDMQSFSEQARGLSFQLQSRPFRKCHFNASDWPYFTDVKSIYQLLLLALIALGIAALNYVLLSLSRVVSRSQEAGIRKTMGAGWKQIVRLFLTETNLLVLLSLLLGFILAVATLPVFNKFTNTIIKPQELFNWNMAAMLVLLCLLLTFIAGIYPALKMAGISPLNMLRKYSTYKISPGLSGVFVTIQYTSCMVLIVFAIVIAQQMKRLYNKDLGFDKEQVLLLQNPFRFDFNQTVSLREQLRNYAASQPAITDFSATGSRYGFADNMNGHVIDGKREYVLEMSVDYDYFSFNRIPLIKGRAFSPEYKIDTIRQSFPAEALDSTSSRTMMNIVVNETLYNMLGKPVLGEINRPMGSIIVGVCKDYYTMGANRKIDPMYHVCRPKNAGYFLVRVGKDQSMAAVLDKLKLQWDKMTGNQPFTYYFMDEDVKKVYEYFQRWMNIISSASWLAIIIACLGLFGLSAVTAVNRTREVGIRKVLGAGIAQLFFTLNKSTFLIVLLSFVLAVPVALYISNDWLEVFADRISLHWSIFAVSGFIGILCAVAAVSFHTVKAATSNPVKSLRTE